VARITNEVMMVRVSRSLSEFLVLELRRSRIIFKLFCTLSTGR